MENETAAKHGTDTAILFENGKAGTHRENAD